MRKQNFIHLIVGFEKYWKKNVWYLNKSTVPESGPDWYSNTLARLEGPSVTCELKALDHLSHCTLATLQQYYTLHVHINQNTGLFHVFIPGIFTRLIMLSLVSRLVRLGEVADGRSWDALTSAAIWCRTRSVDMNK